MTENDSHREVDRARRGSGGSAPSAKARDTADEDTRPPAEDLPVAELADATPPLAEPVPAVATPVAKPVRKAKPAPTDKARAADDESDRPLPQPARKPAREAPVAEEVAPPPEPEAPAPPVPPADEASPPARPRRHWGWRFIGVVLLALVLVLVLAVVFLPQILSLGPVRRYAMDEANRRLPVRVDVGGWSLSWFGDQAVDAVAVQTPSGRPAARIQRVTLERGLWALLMDRTDLGPIRVVGGEAWADAFDELGAAFEETPPLPEPPVEPGEPTPPETEPTEPAPPEPEPSEPAPPEGPGPAPLIPEVVEVRGFTLHTGEDLVRVENATLTRGRGDDARDTFQATLQADYGTQRGTISAEGHLTGLSADWQGADRLGVEVTLTATDLPLGPLTAAAAPDGAVQVTGTVAGRLVVNRSREGRILVSTNVTGSAIQASGKALKGDTPTAETLTLVTEATYDHGALTVGGLELTVAALPVASTPAGSPPPARQVAKVTASGTFALAAEGAHPKGEGTAAVDLDLGRLAPMFRRSLGLHEELVIEGGTLEGRLVASTGADASAVDLTADVSGFRGRRRGTRVDLSPMHVEAHLVRANPAAGAEANAAAPPTAPAETAPAPKPTWVVLAESVDVKSFVVAAEGFGKVTASGRLDRLVLDAGLDLARAADEVGRFVDLGGYGAAGAATVHLETGRSLEGDITSATTVTVKGLEVDLPGGARLSEPQATLSSRSVLRFDAQHRLTEADLSALALEARTASLTASGGLTRAGDAWTFQANATGKGTVANLAGVAAVLLPLLDRPAPVAEEAPAEPASPDAAAPVPVGAAPVRGHTGNAGPAGLVGVPAATDAASADETDAGWLAEVLALCRRASAKERPAQGTWTVGFDAGGTTGEVLGVRADVVLADLRMPPAAGDPADAEPFNLDRATLAADILYAPGAARTVTVNAFNVATPGATVTVEGPTTVLVDGAATTFDRPATVTVTANLPAVVQMLRPLGWMPADPELAGDVKVTLVATPGTDGPAKVNVAVVGEQIDVAWADGRQYTDPRVQVMAGAALTRNEAGDIQAVDVAEWTAATVAGSLKGTATGARTEDGWQWGGTADGAGAIEPVAHTVARLLGAEHRPIRGVWNLTAAYAGDGRRVQLEAKATDLVLPRPDPEGPADVRLQDMDVQVTAALGGEGRIQIEQASVTGPGLTASGAGVVRLPDEAHPQPSADGQVEAAVDLVALAQVLRPFGLLADADRLAGHAAFSGEVRTDATGLGGSGTLTLADLEVHRAESGTTFREAKARLPLVFAHVAELNRWEVAARDMSATTARGTWRVAIQEAEPRPLMEVTCDLAFDGGRVRDLLGKRLPPELTLAGPYRLQTRLAGPLPETSDAPPVAIDVAAGADEPEVPTWHRHLAPMQGDGALTVSRFTYATLEGGDGTIRWALGDGVLRLSPDPTVPSRLTVAEGAVTLAGRIDLTGDEPHLVIDERVRVIENLPLAGEQVRAYLKYASPVLAASVGARGLLTLDVVSLDVPLGGDARRQAVGDLVYQIDQFQTELFGPLGRLVTAGGGQGRSVEQTLGPIEVTLRDGVFTIPDHTLQYTPTVGLQFGGRIGLDKRMNVMVGVPVTQALLEKYKVSERALPYLQDVVLAVPLTGTIDDPQLDNQALAKRIGELALEAIKRETLKHLGDFFKR